MKRLVLMALVVAAFSGRHAFAEEGVLPAGVVADLVRKVAPYERGYEKRAADGFVIAVVFSAASDVSRQEKDLVAAALEERIPTARVVAISDAAIADEKDVDLMVLCEGVALDETVADAARRGVLAIALRTSHVEHKNGAPMGLVPRKGKPRILVNLGASEKASLTIDARLLGLAELVDATARAAATP